MKIGCSRETTFPSECNGTWGLLESCDFMNAFSRYVTQVAFNFFRFDRPFEEVIYPKGDPDAVSISKRDVDLLLPDTFVNDTIIDFYIK